MNYTTQNGKNPSVLPRGKVMTAPACVALQRLMAALGRLRHSEHERYLAASVDRFELERRERAWSREKRRLLWQ